MRITVTTLIDTAKQVAESTLSIVGIRVGTAEPPYVSEPVTDHVELRRYGPRIAAETTVADDEDAARSAGFRRLARYIFGGNHRDDKIAMTAPVAQAANCGEKIAMTAPVAQSAGHTDIGEGWVIRFFMPDGETLETLPIPDDDRVRLVDVPSEAVAVLKFSGDRGPRAVAEHTAELLAVLASNGITAEGEPTAWFYDPPWTLPCRRRNEVAVRVGD